MREAFEILLLTAYFIPAGILVLFGLNLYFMLFMFWRRRNDAAPEVAALMQTFEREYGEAALPHVVTQIPLYNEYNVAERAIRAAAEMDYPAGRHTLQILDDSNDDTCELVDRVAEDLRNQGRDVQVIRRPKRIGYKAGALAYGMEQTEADFFAIFDADFVPTRDFLLRTLPVMVVRPDIGLVQGRWGHLNPDSSMVTRAQSIGIDGHFTVEQPARAWNGFFMNFNGTAGVWRRQAVEDAGGWEHDTLTEDMDLSYRAQLAGWKPFYLFDLVVPAELPESINGFKSQQFRWAKGSMQTALKLLPRVFRAPCSFACKLQAFFHMTHYCVNPLMLWIAVASLPVLHFTAIGQSLGLFLTLVCLLVLSTLAPSTLYATSQYILYGKGLRRLRYLPILMGLGVGLALSNTRAVAEALLGVESGFVRTPKKGDRPVLAYRVRTPLLGIFEVVIGLYCFFSLACYLHSAKYIIGPFLLIYACGFTGVGVLSVIHSHMESRLASS